MNQSKINAGGINQQPMHAVTAAFANSININVQSINNQCALHQQTMRIAPDSLMPGFSRTKTFTLSSMSPIPVILRGAEGEVAESILLESMLSQGVWGDRLQSPFSSEGEGFASLFETVDSATPGKPFVQNDLRVG